MSTARQATPSDLHRMARTACVAFEHDPLIRWFFPSDAEYAEQGPFVWRLLVRRSLAWSSAFTTDDSVAVALFAPPGRDDTGIDPETDAPPQSDALRERYRALGEIMGERTPAEPHWYLGVLATHPHWQRQGLGAMVMAPIGEVCRQEGLAIYLETTTTANVAYYSHLGFRVRSEWDLPLDGPHMWGMVREL